MQPSRRCASTNGSIMPCVWRLRESIYRKERPWLLLSAQCPLRKRSVGDQAEILWPEGGGKQLAQPIDLHRVAVARGAMDDDVGPRPIVRLVQYLDAAAAGMHRLADDKRSATGRPAKEQLGRAE